MSRLWLAAHSRLSFFGRCHTDCWFTIISCAKASSAEFWKTLICSGGGQWKDRRFPISSFCTGDDGESTIDMASKMSPVSLFRQRHSLISWENRPWQGDKFARGSKNRGAFRYYYVFVKAQWIRKAVKVYCILSCEIWATVKCTPPGHTPWSWWEAEQRGTVTGCVILAKWKSFRWVYSGMEI